MFFWPTKRGHTLENIPNEGIHDFHGLWGNFSVGVHLLQNLVHVDFERLLTRLLVSLARVFFAALAIVEILEIILISLDPHAHCIIFFDATKKISLKLPSTKSSYFT